MIATTTATTLTGEQYRALVLRALRQAPVGKVHAFPIVRYHGSIEAERGRLWSVEAAGGRLWLVDAYRYKLTNVRPGSVSLVAVPALTERRAEALRELADRYGAFVPTREWNWLQARGLVEVDGDGRRRTTALGMALAAALRW